MRKSAEFEVHPASFRDPSGFVFKRNGRLYRQVNHAYAAHYEALVGSGLYDRLIGQGRLLPHAEVDEPAARPEEAFKILAPELLDFVSYPYEWCFSELKDAALAILATQRIAIEHGLTLKDASAYNIQFHQGRARLVDTLSFEVLEEGEPWAAYRQFCSHFLAPLALMAYRDARLGGLLRNHLDGIPLDLASRVLPRRTWLSPGLLVHLHLHASAQRRYAGKAVSGGRYRRRMSRQALLGLVESLQAAVRRLHWAPTGTAWASYEQFHGYSGADMAEKRRLVEEFLDQVRPASVWDLGANVGSFSRIASQREITTIAFDFDPAAVEHNYLQARQDGDPRLLALVLDLNNPSPAQGWAGKERMSLAERGPAGAVFALALVHHLAISNNVPLGMIAEFLAGLSRWLLIEFVPKEDPQVQRLLANRADIFPDYDVNGFETAFTPHFEIHRRVPVGDSGRSLYRMEGRA